MKKTLASLAVCAAAPLGDALADSGGASPAQPAQHISRHGDQPQATGPADWFTGKVRIEPLFPADEQVNVSAAYVSFEAGARSAWHTHPAGQRLVVTAGMGLTQEWGKPVQQIHPGDVIVCPAGVKHWHGAAPGSAMTHLAITASKDGKNVDWMEHVTDDQYHAR